MKKMQKIIIEKEKNQLKLSFNRLFYKIQFIDKAIDDFSEICYIEKNNDILILKPKMDIDIEILGYEFYNYVLCLIKNI